MRTALNKNISSRAKSIKQCPGFRRPMRRPPCRNKARSSQQQARQPRSTKYHGKGIRGITLLLTLIHDLVLPRRLGQECESTTVLPRYQVAPAWSGRVLFLDSIWRLVNLRYIFAIRLFLQHRGVRLHAPPHCLGTYDTLYTVPPPSNYHGVRQPLVDNGFKIACLRHLAHIYC